MAAFEPQIELASGTLLDFKSALQERLAREGRTVTYAIVEESGPPHDRHLPRRGAGRRRGARAPAPEPSKKAAEQAAAAEALGTPSDSD